MKRYRGSSLKIDWEDDELLAKVEDIVDVATERLASIAVNKAQQLVRVDTGQIRSEIDMKKSKIQPGTWIVEAQGPGNYKEFYATFLEMGHHSSQGGKYSRKKKNITSGSWVPGKPFMRPTLKYIRRMMRKTMKDAIGDTSA